MNKPKMTFAEGLRISWHRELQSGDPVRIVRLAFFSLYFGTIHLVFFSFPNALIRIGKRLMNTSTE